jgi:MoxR-like ATPase
MLGKTSNHYWELINPATPANKHNFLKMITDSLFSKLQNFRGALNAASLERQHVIDGLLATLLSKQNAFLLGAPGTGKSDLVRSICKGIEGANYFGYLLTPTTDPSEVFGPVAVTKLLKDEYTRDVAGYLPDAHIGFLDELFRGSSAILNSLLTLLNERTFNNGKDVIDTPIQSIVAATNSWPDEESLQAFADRFLFRPTVDFLRKPTSKRKLDEWASNIVERPKVEVHLTLEDLRGLQEIASKITVSEDFLDRFGQVWDSLASRNILISDRRRVQIIKFLKAWAVVQGDDELYPEHLHNSIVHIVYQTKEDQSTIEEVLEQEIPTAERVFNDAKRAAAGIMSEYTSNAHKQKARGLDDLNSYVVMLRKYHKDMQLVRDKVGEILDGTRFRMNITTRSTGVKLQRNLQTHCDTLAQAISDIAN